MNVIQIIRDERARLLALEKEIEMSQKELAVSLANCRREMRDLYKQCSHPNAVRSSFGEYPTIDCPDCGYGSISLVTPRIKKSRKKIVET